MKNYLKKLSALLAFACIFALLPISAAAAPPQKVAPGFEVKFLLDPDVVLENGELKQEFKDLFEINDYNDRLVQYIDTTDKAFEAEGWTNRVRVKASRKKDYRFELSFKKRYAVEDLGSGINWEAMEATINKARKDGFYPGSDVYPAEIDWGYNKATLSFTWEENVYRTGDYSHYPIKFTPPALEDATTMLLEHMKRNERDWKGTFWATDLLNRDAHLYGTIYYRKYVGVFSGAEDDEISCEVWPIKDETGEGKEYIVEVSFGVPSAPDAYETADTLRTNLLDTLRNTKIDGKNILIEGDGLKTATILDRYGPVN